MSLGTAIVSATRFTALSHIATLVIKLGVPIILAQLLDPKDFGLMAMALIITGFTDIFKEMGTVSTIVQRQELTSELLSSLFYLNIFFGFITAGCIAAGAPALARFYADSRLSPILQVLSLVTIMSSFGLVKSGLLQRDMRFARLALVEVSTALIHGVVAIILAILGWAVWALVGGAVAASVMMTLLLWLAIEWRPRRQFTRAAVSSSFDFSLNLTAFKILTYLFFNIDSVVIGRFLGATPLGYYALAQRIFMVSVGTIGQVLNRVVFAALSRIQDDSLQLRQKYLRACGGIALIMFPALAGLSVLARPFTLGLLGPKWIPAIPLIAILSPIAMIQSIASTVGVIYLVKGRTGLLCVWSIISSVLVTSSMIVGLQWGLIGVASAYLVATVLLTYPAFAISFGLIELRVSTLGLVLWPYVKATIAMVCCVLIVRAWLELNHVEPYLVLTSGVIIGAAAYSAMILHDRPQGLMDFQKLVTAMRRSPR